MECRYVIRLTTLNKEGGAEVYFSIYGVSRIEYPNTV